MPKLSDNVIRPILNAMDDVPIKARKLSGAPDKLKSKQNQNRDGVKDTDKFNDNTNKPNVPKKPDVPNKGPDAPNKPTPPRNDPDKIAKNATILDDGTVVIKLKFKEGWEGPQIDAARAKIDAINASDAVKTEVPPSLRTVNVRKLYMEVHGLKAKDMEGLDVDHIVELQINGTNAIENLQALDSSVNRSMGAQIFHGMKGLLPDTPVRFEF